MDAHGLYDTPAALKSRMSHYKAHSEKQAATIVGLQGKVVDLEAKIAYLQEVLMQERGKKLVATAGARSQAYGPEEPRTLLLEAGPSKVTQAGSPCKPSIAHITRPYTPAPSHSGSADDPFVLEDEVDEIVNPPVAIRSPNKHATPPHKRKECLSPVILPDSLSSVWPPFESPRKKPKFWIEIPRISKRGSVAHASAIPAKKSERAPESEEQLGEAGTAPQEPREISLSPMSDLSSPPESPAPAEVLLEDMPPLSPALDEPNHPQRSYSREVSYADFPVDRPLPAHPVADNTSRFDRIAPEGAGPASSTQVTIATFPARLEVPHAPGPSASKPASTVSAQAGPSRIQAASPTNADYESARRQRPLSPAPAASSNRSDSQAPRSAPGGMPRIKDRVDALPRYQIPQVDPSLLALRVSRLELHDFWGLSTGQLSAEGVPHKQPGHFLFPTMDKNPFLPRGPGKPGLLYRANDAYKWRDGVQTVFVQRRSAEHEYIGEYELQRAAPLSPAEFTTWTPDLKKTWATSIRDQAKFIDIWARIVLRQSLGREPTPQEISRKVMERKAQKKAFRAEGRSKSKSKGKGRVPGDPEDVARIIKAYQNGDEKMDVWTMVCVGFQSQLLVKIGEGKDKAAIAELGDDSDVQ